METFWRTIAYYNAATWGWQLLLILAGICLTVQLVRRPAPWVKRAMKVYLAVLYLWIAVVYYFVCCRERDYNEVMALFWALPAAIWVWDLATGYTTFERSHKYDVAACVLLSMPFLYPLISLTRGLTFPMTTSPVMPCSVSVFTIGLLLFFARRVNLFLVLLLCHWALIGLTKAESFHIPEDFVLVATAIPGLYLFFKERYLTNLRRPTKPKAKYIDALLIAVCISLAILLLATMVSTLFSTCDKMSVAYLPERTPRFGTLFEEWIAESPERVLIKQAFQIT